MKRIFGFRKKKKRGKESPTMMMSPMEPPKEGDGLHLATSPMYEYAREEFSQTIAAGTSNDDGRGVLFQAHSSASSQNHSNVGSNSSSSNHTGNQPLHPQASQYEELAENPAEHLASPIPSNSSTYQPPHTALSPMTPMDQYLASTRGEDSRGGASLDQSSFPPPISSSATMSNVNPSTASSKVDFYNERDFFPDATYEEEYGNAYVGGPMRYIYPSGYQSMRPRSGPWKLSMVVCISFTWLSVFIIGYCSDRVDQTQYDQYEIDDDTLVIETRWCGSRLLYMMWVISMLVTGFAAAYCSIIGYIKVRDFAVANSRSQPPGMLGISDYYAKVNTRFHSDGANHETGSGASSSHSNHYVPIYQADGTPQFWGGHIYRPTQAAVAITSR